MAKDTYPSEKFTEEDRTVTVRSNSSSICACAGRFEKGPVGKPILISDKNNLISYFGKPRSGSLFNNLESWYNVDNFLQYAAGIYVMRIESETTLNAGKNFNDSAADLSLNINIPDGTDMSGVSELTDTGINFVAKNPGTWGNYVKVATCLAADANQWTDGYYYDSRVQITCSAGITGLVVGDYVVAENGATGIVEVIAGDSDEIITIAYNGTAFSQTALSNKIHEGQIYNASDPNIVTITDEDTTAPVLLGIKTFMDNFTEEFETNQIGIIVWVSEDEGATYSLEEKHIVSTVVTAKTHENEAMYIDYYLEKNSKYISSIYVSSGASLASITTATALTGGIFGSAPSTGDVLIALDDKYRSPQDYKFDFLIDGAYAGNLSVMNKIIDIVEFRKDSFGILSSGIGITVSTESQAVADLQTIRDALTGSTRTAFYGNYKYHYDSFGGRTFKCSLSGDIAGIFARSDLLTQPWFSPAGYNRGDILNVQKLGFYPSKINQGILHTNQINIVTYDKKENGYFVKSAKTIYGRPSAFQDIPVRRLFTYCEQNILDSAKAFTWEFNDNITRSNFYTIVNNFLTGVKGKRGIYEFKAVCDESNNTADIIDTNQLIMDVFIKPSRSINYITLRFTATRTDANFDELVA